MPPIQPFEPFNPTLINPTIMRLPPGVFGVSLYERNTITESFFPPPPADPYAPQRASSDIFSGGLIPELSPFIPPENLLVVLPRIDTSGCIPIPVLPQIDTSNCVPVPTLPQINGTGGALGAGNRMTLFNRYRLQFQEGQDFYRAQIPDNANPGRHITDEAHKYYWLPDGSLLRTNNDGTGGQIISMNTTGTEQLPARNVDNADTALIAWGRTLASQGGLIPVNNGATYARGGNADNSEYILGQSNGSVYRLEGPAGRLAEFRWNIATSSMEETIPNLDNVNIARALRALSLRPRRHNEIILGGNGANNITHRPNQWVGINPDGPPNEVYEIHGVLPGGLVDIRFINTNNTINVAGQGTVPTQANNLNEELGAPRIVSCRYNTATGAITYFVRVHIGGGNFDWRPAQAIPIPNSNAVNWYMRDHSNNLRVLRRVGINWRWDLNRDERGNQLPIPDGLNI